MLSRRLTSTLVGTAAVGLLAATGCSEQAAAIRVGDQHVSQSDFMDEVDERFDELRAEVPPEQLDEDGDWRVGQPPRGQLEDSYDQEVLGLVVQQRVQLMLLRELLEAEDLELTDSHLETAQAQLPQIRQQLLQQQQPFPYEGLPTRLQEEALAIQQLVSEQPNAEELQQEFIDLVESTDVDISPRFGTWDADAFAAGQPSVLPSDGALVEADGGEDEGSILQGSPQE